jgi:hypothetical protein
MSDNQNTLVIPDEIIMGSIILLRGKKVILDTDLAKLYGVPTKRLNEQVKRNIKRFPEHFMFHLTNKEKEQVVATCDHLKKLKYSPFLPYAFTDHGIIMLANVLNNDRAIQISIRITEVFIKMHEVLTSHNELFIKLRELEKKVTRHDEKIILVFEYLKQLEKDKEEGVEFKNRPRIGFKTRRE